MSTSRSPVVAALIAVLAVPSGAMAAAEVEISWDRDLAFEWDRERYPKLLGEIVRSGEEDVSAWLGWRRTRPLAVVVLTPARYAARFGNGVAQASGALYAGGAIHVNGGARLDELFAATVAHELTHALLDDEGTAHALPTWLNEGIAERLRARRLGQTGLTTTEVQQLEIALEQRRLVPLPTRGWLSRLGYLQSFAAVLFLEQKLGKDQLLALVRRTLRSGSFERSLDAELRWSTRDVDDRFAYWVDHLQ